MQKLAKRILRRVYLGLIAAKRQISYQFKRNLRHVDSTIIESYFAEHKIRKLHIGCGGNTLAIGSILMFSRIRMRFYILMQLIRSLFRITRLIMFLVST